MSLQKSRGFLSYVQKRCSSILPACRGGKRPSNLPQTSSSILLHHDHCDSRRSYNSSSLSSRRYYDQDNTTPATTKTTTRTALVLGSSGTLGSAVSQHFSENLEMDVIGVDVLPNENQDWPQLGFIQLGPAMSISEMAQEMILGVESILGTSSHSDENNSNKKEKNHGDDRRLHCIFCASGGWEGDPKNAMDPIAYGTTVENMMRMNLYPVVAAGNVAHHFMIEEPEREDGGGGLFVVMGAMAALQPTPGMMAYGLSKAAAHHFVQTLGSKTGKSLSTPGSREKMYSLRDWNTEQYLEHLTVTAVLPSMLDTPANRRADPDADFSVWVKPEDVAEEVGKWVETPALRPHSGGLVSVKPRKGGGSAFWPVR